MRRILESLGAGIVLLFISKGIDKFEIGYMKTIFQTFFVELWFIWVGILGGIVYWLVRFLVGLDKSVKGKMDFEEAKRNVIQKFQEEVTKKAINIMKDINPLLQQEIDSHTKQIDDILKVMDSYNRQFGNVIQWISALHDSLIKKGFEIDLTEKPKEQALTDWARDISKK